jgi:hypothetical protein
LAIEAVSTIGPAGANWKALKNTQVLFIILSNSLFNRNFAEGKHLPNLTNLFALLTSFDAFLFCQGLGLNGQGKWGRTQFWLKKVAELHIISTNHPVQYMSCQAHTTGQGSFLYQLSIQHKSCHLWDL